MVDSMNIPQIKTKNMTFIMNIKSLFQIVTSGRFRTLAIFFDGGQSVLKTPAVWQTCSLSNFSWIYLCLTVWLWASVQILNHVLKRQYQWARTASGDRGNQSIAWPITLSIQIILKGQSVSQQCQSLWRKLWLVTVLLQIIAKQSTTSNKALTSGCLIRVARVQ